MGNRDKQRKEPKKPKQPKQPKKPTPALLNYCSASSHAGARVESPLAGAP